jgi:ABC-type sugar transport system permease subunit
VSVIAVVLGLVLALAFGSQSRLHQLVRLAFLMPSVAGGVGAISAWKWMANSESYGLFNSVRAWFGLEPARFLGDPVWSMVILVMIGVWSVVGYNMVLFVAGMRAIPRHLYEAATLDGATRWQRLWHVTLPMLRPTLLYVLVTGMIASFQVFYEPYLMFGTVDNIGGPLDSALMLVTYLFDYGFRQLDLGIASAAAWVLTTLLFGLTWLNMRIGGASETRA